MRNMKQKQLNECINLIEALAKENSEESAKCRQKEKYFAEQYFAGKAAGLESAAYLLRISSNTEIPFEK